MLAAHFDKGARVEVNRGENSSLWFPASVIRPFPAKHKGQIYVEFETLTSGKSETKRLREYVSEINVRPSPPVELHRYFKLGEKVDAFHEKAWRVGTIVDILENSRYSVSFDGVVEQFEFDHWNLRFHRDWDDGSWIPPFHQQMQPKELKLRIKFSGKTSEVKYSKGAMVEVGSDKEKEKETLPQRSSGLEMKSKETDVKFKEKVSRRTSEAKFSEGTMVEVKSDDEGYQCSWFTAVILRSIGKDEFLIEYQTLKTEDETELLKEKAKASYIRPCPPNIQRLDRFKLFEKVDAWYNDGWWVGLISRVLDGLNYAVYFWSTNEEIEFGHFGLRPHQEWVNGKWVADFRKKTTNLSPKPRPGKLKSRTGLVTLEANYFPKGMKVEVKSDEGGYSYSWYPAVIIGSIGTEKYLVEYKTLKADDENILLKEEADAQCIRPCHPVIQRKDPFEPLEEVDAWYNAAWWVGGVCKVLQGSKYEVYIRGTKEVLEFQHSDLRPHQDWTDGKWSFLAGVGSCDN